MKTHLAWMVCASLLAFPATALGQFLGGTAPGICAGSLDLSGGCAVTGSSTGLNGTNTNNSISPAPTAGAAPAGAPGASMTAMGPENTPSSNPSSNGPAMASAANGPSSVPAIASANPGQNILAPNSFGALPAPMPGFNSTPAFSSTSPLNGTGLAQNNATGFAQNGFAQNAFAQSSTVGLTPNTMPGLTLGPMPNSAPAENIAPLGTGVGPAASGIAATP